MIVEVGNGDPPVSVEVELDMVDESSGAAGDDPLSQNYTDETGWPWKREKSSCTMTMLQSRTTNRSSALVAILDGGDQSARRPDQIRWV